MHVHDRYDVIVIGGGHAGTEAAWAAASVLAARGDGDRRVALVTMDPARIGQMSCNPAIGGLAKGQMVREIDALGGLMARAIDATGIMFKLLNTSKGAAVHGPRAQADKYAYAAEVQRLIASRGPGASGGGPAGAAIEVIAGTVEDFAIEDGRVTGVVLAPGATLVVPDPIGVRAGITDSNPVFGGSRAAGVGNTGSDPDRQAGVPQPIYPASPPSGGNGAAGAPRLLGTRAVVLTTGTFMRGLMHTGERRTAGGRVGEAAARGISSTLERLGFELGRLKTGTPPRLACESIDWDGLDPQVGDIDPRPFCDLSPGILPGGRFPCLPQVECRLTSTVAAAHDIIRANLDRAPMFTGQIDAECGPRYCPSIEDKVMRFAGRDSHHVFLEPESLHTNEIYCNGISTSLPVDVQEQVVHLMPGCERARIIRWGYAVEYDMVWPHQIDATCETKLVRGLYLAGQINCTTGYEEAGAQGLVAGLNAARQILGEGPVRLRRDQAYIGVMLDDLVTKTPREPYRMFTSRAEHRLLLRADNADQRLTSLGRELGLVDDARWTAFEQRRTALDDIRVAMNNLRHQGRTLADLARSGEPADTILAYLHRARAADRNGDTRADHAHDRHLVQRVVTEHKYAGYIARQHAEVRRQAEAERQSIPTSLDPATVAGLRGEAIEVLSRFRPATMGQAARLAGVNPADLTLLAVAIKRKKAES